MSKYFAPSGMPGGTLSLSYSTDARQSLVWATVPLDEDANEAIVRGMLIAFQAFPVCDGACNPGLNKPRDLPLLWHSEIEASRDAVGLYAKFVPPTIADGKVFVASFGDPNYTDPWTRTGRLHEYGLLNR